MLLLLLGDCQFLINIKAFKRQETQDTKTWRRVRNSIRCCWDGHATAIRRQHTLQVSRQDFISQGTTSNMDLCCLGALSGRSVCGRAMVVSAW